MPHKGEEEYLVHEWNIVIELYGFVSLVCRLACYQATTVPFYTRWAASHKRATSFVQKYWLAGYAIGYAAFIFKLVGCDLDDSVPVFVISQTLNVIFTTVTTVPIMNALLRSFRLQCIRRMLRFPLPLEFEDLEEAALAVREREGPLQVLHDMSRLLLVIFGAAVLQSYVVSVIIDQKLPLPFIRLELKPLALSSIFTSFGLLLIIRKAVTIFWTCFTSNGRGVQTILSDHMTISIFILGFSVFCLGSATNTYYVFSRVVFGKYIVQLTFSQEKKKEEDELKLINLVFFSITKAIDLIISLINDLRRYHWNVNRA